MFWFFLYNTVLIRILKWILLSVFSLNLEAKTDTLTKGAREGSHSRDRLPPVLRRRRRW